MPDGRLHDGNGYSTYPPTVKTRERLAALPPGELAAHRARSAEISSVWAACSRVSKTEKYKRANVNHRRQILLQHISMLFVKRGKKGKNRVGINEEGIVEKHLKKEAAERKFLQSINKEEYKVSLKGVSVDQGTFGQGGEDLADYYDVENEIEGYDDTPLPMQLNPDNTASAQGGYSEMIRAIRKIDEKVNALLYQVAANNEAIMQLRGMNFTQPSPFPQPGFMPGPVMQPTNERDLGYECDEKRSGTSAFVDEGYGSPGDSMGGLAGQDQAAENESAAGRVEEHPIEKQQIHPMGFNLSSQETKTRDNAPQLVMNQQSMGQAMIQPGMGFYQPYFPTNNPMQYHGADVTNNSGIRSNAPEDPSTLAMRSNYGSEDAHSFAIRNPRTNGPSGGHRF